MPEDETRSCPYCAETIKTEAVICRFCGYDLRTGEPTRAVPTEGQERVVQARSGVSDGVKLGCGMFIVLPILLLLGGFLLFTFLIAVGGK